LTLSDFPKTSHLQRTNPKKLNATKPPAKNKSTLESEKLIAALTAAAIKNTIVAPAEEAAPTELLKYSIALEAAAGRHNVVPAVHIIIGTNIEAIVRFSKTTKKINKTPEIIINIKPKAI
jgi:hypothetical protein